MGLVSFHDHTCQTIISAGKEIPKAITISSDSPSIDLVAFLINELSTKGIAGGSVLSDALAWLDTATSRHDEASDNFDDGEFTKLLDEANAHAAAITSLIPSPRKLHSLVINWNDDDADEGTFGSTVRAWSHEHAEALVRAEMENMSENPGSDFSGECVDHNIGASWKAEEMEAIIRKLLATKALPTDHADRTAAFQEAENLIVSLDAL